VLKLSALLNNYELFYDYFKLARQKKYRHFYQHIYLEDYSPLPRKSINLIFDETGEIRMNASPALAKLFKKEESLMRQQEKIFGEVLKKYKDAAMLSESGESVRNGRRVLVLPAEKKRQIEGVIHDESASGKTVFIEPAELMSLNNELFSIEGEKRAEIKRILKALSDELRAHIPMLKNLEAQIIKMDVIISKGKLSRMINGVYPKLSADTTLAMKEVRHPILLLQEEKTKHKTIAFNIDLRGPNKLLLISGPNAGGKSVTLKAVGLIHLMLYRGLLVPVDSDSEIGMFDSIFSDIGDQQSIDEGLSTFSSHLHNLKHVVANAGAKSLVLLDEIGSGTDPNAGSAIAEGVMLSLLKKKVHGIITTHYSSLKIFAFKNKGIVNGAMLFDKENLQPSYQLRVGKPGSSYAFEVASQVGLDKEIVQYARRKVGKKENQIEDLLIDLQEDRAMLDEQLQYVRIEKERLDRLVKTYDELHKDLQVRRKKIQVRSREIEFQKASEENLELQQLITKLEKEKNLEKIKKLKDNVQEVRQQKADEIVHIKKEIYYANDDIQSIQVGDYVRMIDSDLSGEVLSIKGEKAVVLFGLMQMTVNLADVVRANVQLDLIKNKRINVKGVAFESNFSPKIDIRGYKVEDAEMTLQEFFDKALLNNARYLEVVHGKGSGALRKVLLRKMKEYRDIQSYWHADDDKGGDGVTMIKM
jgi:DNA mismatch repair protein MutS2